MQVLGRVFCTFLVNYVSCFALYISPR